MKLITALATTTLATLVASTKGGGKLCPGLSRRSCRKADGCVFVKWKSYPDKVKNKECRFDEGCPTWPSKFRCKKNGCYWHGTKASGSCKKDPPTDEDKKRCRTRPKKSRCKAAGCFWAAGKSTGECFDKAPACDYYTYAKHKRTAKKYCIKAGCHWEGTKKGGECLNEAPTTKAPTTTDPPTTRPAPIGVKYELHGASKHTRDEGHDICVAKDCRLPNVRNDKERNDVLGARGSHDRIWTNALKVDDRTTFRWDNGTGLSFAETTNYWIPGEPGNQTGDEWCVEIWGWGTRHGGEFNDIECDYLNTHGVVCECDIYPEPPKKVGVRYEFHSNAGHTRTAAHDACVAKGGRLPNIRNDTERNGAINAWSAGKYNRFWTNGFKVDGKFYWDNGTGQPFSETTRYWMGSEPGNQSGNEDCVEIYGWGGDGRHAGQFNDIECGYPIQGVVCEFDVWE